MVLGDDLLDQIRYFDDAPDTYIVEKTRPNCRINEVFSLLREGTFTHCHGIIITVGTSDLVNDDFNAAKDLLALLHFVIL